MQKKAMANKPTCIRNSPLQVGWQTQDKVTTENLVTPTIRP